MGGLPVLFPILEQLALVTPDQQSADPAAGSDFITPDVTTPADGDWVILPSNRASGLLCCTFLKTSTLLRSCTAFTKTFLFLRGSSGEESGGYFPFGAEALPAETPGQPGDSSPFVWCWNTWSPAAKGFFFPFLFLSRHKNILLIRKKDMLFIPSNKKY